jgi:hypothetical protein
MFMLYSGSFLRSTGEQAKGICEFIIHMFGGVMLLGELYCLVVLLLCNTTFILLAILFL